MMTEHSDDKVSHPLFTHRTAQFDDIPAIVKLMEASIVELQKGFLTPQEVEASKDTMGLDTSLIEDQTYFIILSGEGTKDEVMVGCGGWGMRATLFGGNHSAGRSDDILNPKSDPARIRAMYCHPNWARKGIGRYIMALGEAAAKKHGFTKLILGSTLSGQPLYEKSGFTARETLLQKNSNGVIVPIIKMTKDI